VLRVNEVKVAILPVRYSGEMSKLRRIVSFLQFLFLGSLYSMTWKGDLIFATSTPLTIAMPGIMGTRLGSRPLVFEVRDLWPEAPIALGYLRSRLLVFLARWLEKTAYRKARKVISLSPGMTAGIREINPDVEIRLFRLLCG